jgi:3-phosphoshikimate 1-carboxyvinyltransferase
MKQFGWEVENRNYEAFHFAGTSSTLSAESNPSTTLRTYTVEGDWSGAAFLLVTGAIAGNITVKGLDVQSTQADRAVLQALQSCGAKLSIQPEQIEVGPAALKAFQFNATECPDLFPPLVALASYCKGTTVIEGVSRLAHKESDRGLTLQEEFGKMGVEIELQDDLMLIKGGNGLKGAAVHSRHDHRIAMACAVAALKATGETVISEAQAINKSYPDFYEHIQALGAVVSKEGVKA